MRPPVLRLHEDELVVDNFAGGGGASLGIEWALGRSPDVAVNHDPEAVAMHAANHPTTRHYCESVWEVDPVEVCGGRPVGLAWFSPDCKHFSKAKGGKPVDKRIRSLAWVVIRWARAVKPRVICLENVEEFQDWGPLLPDGKPDWFRRGLTFRNWVGQLRGAGYRVEARQLRACDYGAPTSRKRLFVVARCDGQPIVWPEPTHGPGRLPYRTAAEIIDWSLPCPSIFERARPLADATLRRIARGMRKFVLEAGEPFIVPVKTWGGGGNEPRTLDAPLRTITASKRGEYALVAPTLIQTGYGERAGQAPRCLDLHQPLGTIVAQGQKHALVAAFLAKHYGGVTGSPLPEPIGTITSVDHHSLVTSHLLKLRGGLDDHGVTAQAIAEPVPTITAGGMHLAEVRAFLTSYYGQGDGQSARDPLRTITTKDRFALVTVAGKQYAIADIGMRMLAAPELFLGQGFPASYHLDVVVNGKPLTQTTLVRLVGNSVSPPLGAAIVRAQFAADEADRRSA